MSKTTKKEAPRCPVCLDHFTSVIRQPIRCQYCPYESCRQCTSQYLLTSLNDPHCMGCKREWNREFIDTKLTQTFRKGALRQHRRKVLIDRERGRLPAMQVFLEARIDYDEAAKVYNQSRARRHLLKKTRIELQATHATTDTLEQLTIRLRPINKERTELKGKMAAAEAKMRAANLILTGKEKEVKQFIMKCPSGGEEPCRGFLSTAWKCGTCQKFFCADCHAEKAGHQDESHVCNPDAKATASMIKQETKGCPKCGVRISKIDGCDQMWCTSCQTTFSWISGQVLLNTVVHNPHYYEYLRKTNGAIPREAGDVPCGGLPNAYMFTRQIMEVITLTQTEKTEILDIVRCLSDIQYVRLPQFPLRQPANVNQELDIKYLMKEITQEEWGTAMEKIETTGERKKELGLILQTLLHVGSEKLTQLQNTTRDQRGVLAKLVVEELREVRAYSNKSMIEKGVQMGIVVPHITTDWRWSWMRKAGMKATLEEKDPSADSEAEVEGAEPSAAATVATVATVTDTATDTATATATATDDADVPNEDSILVEIEGEMVEMTHQQARDIFAI